VKYGAMFRAAIGAEALYNILKKSISTIHQK
jgi:hypothetical protein